MYLYICIPIHVYLFGCIFKAYIEEVIDPGCAVCSVQCAVCSVQCAVYSVQCVQCAVCSVHHSLPPATFIAHTHTTQTLQNFAFHKNTLCKFWLTQRGQLWAVSSEHPLQRMQTFPLNHVKMLNLQVQGPLEYVLDAKCKMQRFPNIWKFSFSVVGTDFLQKKLA